MSLRNVLIVVGILLITPFVVKAEEAQNPNEIGGSENVAMIEASGTLNGSTTSSVPAVIPEEPMRLHLDQGFVGRPVSFDLFKGQVTVAWDAKTLIRPTTLTVSRTRGGAGDAGQAEAAKGVALQFEGEGTVNAKGAIRITIKADRPPAKTERVRANIFSATSSTVEATFKKDRITIVSVAFDGLAVVPFFEDGIMRSGLASWYKYKNCNCAASPDVPKGTKLKVARQDDPSRFVIVTVNDWGPDRRVHPERVIDLDKVAFAKIGNPRGGVLPVTVDVYEEKRQIASKTSTP